MKAVRFIPAIAWFVISAVLFCLPGSLIPSQSWFYEHIPQMDKIVHVTIFTLLGITLAYPVKKSSVSHRNRVKWFLFVAIMGILYGTAVEFVQRAWIANRSFDVYDIAADTIGCLLAFIFNMIAFTERA
ncbi:VanZ like family protein [Sediminibacterium ginsengisoli]|uniref:VanZ like family protein n=1 Tax=Sediminibacterium ginsengisoli TaxID=413434 RepID=A0A1T4JS63_9BACT|nr:VanZ like family protein [Sediminibacterium ginsengisoli]